MGIDTRVASKLVSLSKVPEPLRSAILEKLDSHESIRLVVYAPGFSMLDEGPETPATAIAVTNNSWFVGSAPKDGDVTLEKSKFSDTLFVQLYVNSSRGPLKIDFASVGTSYHAVMEFNTVTEELYREAIHLVLDGIDQTHLEAEAAENNDDASTVENWSIPFRTEALRYRPKGQRLLGATQWPAIIGGFRRELVPAGALLVTKRALLLISEEKHLLGFTLGISISSGRSSPISVHPTDQFPGEPLRAIRRSLL